MNIAWHSTYLISTMNFINVQPIVVVVIILVWHLVLLLIARVGAMLANQKVSISITRRFYFSSICAIFACYDFWRDFSNWLNWQVFDRLANVPGGKYSDSKHDLSIVNKYYSYFCSKSTISLLLFV